MRVWVRSEYARELAVVFAWLAALVPWNVTYAVLGEFGTQLTVRFPLFQVRFLWFAAGGSQITARHAYAALKLQGAQPTVPGYRAWVAGAAVVALAVLLSVALYAAEQRVASALRRPVQLMGGLLLVAGFLNAAATVLLWRLEPATVLVPVGVVFELAFGVLLLTAERV
ncbi:MAG: hypothetical protein ABEH77_02120 [Halobacteriaceae archaeon]